jgi:hypothetical protein
MSTVPRSGIRPLLCLGLLVAAAALACGCNIVTPIVYAVSPPPKQAPMHYLADRPTVVYVDDRRNVLTYRGLRRRIADVVIGELLANEVLTAENAISSRNALAIVAQNDRYSDPMSIQAIGQAVGAEQIIYVEVESATTSLDGYTTQPAAVCEVRVIDVVSRQRLFPLGSDPNESVGHSMRIVAQRIGTPAAASGVSTLQAYELLAAEMGSQIAKLFYEHSVEKIGKNLQTR